MLRFIVLIIIWITIYSCSSTKCLEPDQVSNIDDNLFYKNALKYQNDKKQLVKYVFDNLAEIDTSDWGSSIILIKVASLISGDSLEEKKMALIYKAQKILGQKFKKEKDKLCDRYIMAHIYYKQGTYYQKLGNDFQAKVSFQYAYNLSPDRFNDKPYSELKKEINGLNEYRSPYAYYLESIHNYKEAWAIWAELAEDNEIFLSELERLHLKLYKHKDFKSCWRESKFTHYPDADNLYFTTENGDTMSIEKNFSNIWLLVDFWTDYCGPCFEQFPTIDKLDKELKNDGSENKIITIAEVKDWQNISNLKTKIPWDYQFFVGKRIYNEKNIAYLKPYKPYKIIVTPDGHYFELPNNDWEIYAQRFLFN